MEVPLWVDLSLSNGHPGVSLVFSGASAGGRRNAERAHGHLARGMAAAAGVDHEATGVYHGPGALAFAALIAHRATGGYRSALDRLDAYQRQLVRTRYAGLAHTTDAPVHTNGEYEVVRGMTGVGRYLLARGRPDDPELAAVLRYLVAMSRGTVPHRGHAVPRWWTRAAPLLGGEADLPDGHLNLGLSHGVAGPLALLALAWRAGVTVPGQRAAIEELMALLTEWAVKDREGVGWAGVLTLDDWLRGPSAAAPVSRRPSWCYGAPGVSRAVQLAALALDRADWHDLAHRSLLPLLATPPERWPTDDPSLCHGWAGLLHLVGLLREHLDDPRLAGLHDELAGILLSHHRDDVRFGYRATLTGVPGGADLPSFLEGAGGVALALDSYAAGGGPAPLGWDMPLLVA
ncbi:lanthionine synthetase C family protein [Streptomyces mayteni]